MKQSVLQLFALKNAIVCDEEFAIKK